MAKTSKQLRAENPAKLTLFCCDRCSRLIDSNEEPEHFHREQCGGCKKYKSKTGDWGFEKEVVSERQGFTNPPTTLKLDQVRSNATLRHTICPS